ncbi:Mecr [Symbiodinium sp. KB8]|nr:Mecr [Symbiodinium sp. KB8]
MSEADYYQLIGVGRDATLHEIRSKFRAKVLAEHPDKGGDPKKFQLLNKAYNVLTDQEKRRRYDTTGRAEKSAEEEFVEGFAGGRHHFEPRSKDADEKAIVSLKDRIITGNQTHEEGFAEWLRQRDQQAMVLTDKDFMKTHLFNASELATKINHPGPVQHVLGSPKTDAYGQAMGGAVQVQVKPRPLKKTIDHDEVLVRMLAVPVDDSMVYADLKKTGVCLGMTGVGRVEQAGTRVEDLKPEDAVLVLPKPTKFSSGHPIGTGRTLLTCSEDDLLRIPSEILEQLTPEQICLTPTIVCAYTVLEQFGSKLKPGDSVLINAAHLSASGSALLQLCKLLKLKPLCMLPLPGSPKNLAKGEYGSKAAWAEVDNRAAATPTVRAQYERISEQLVTMGAEEVFPDAVALLRWRDRNQRMLPKLALDGIATRDSCEQLIHCLQSGDKDAQIVVYGHGIAQPLEISPPLLAAWGGRIVGFNISRWVHSLSANAKKMMAVMENVTKLVRANKFVLDTVVYKVGEDACSEAFSRAADASDNTQVVLVFPTLQEELALSAQEQRAEREKQAKHKEEEAAKKKEEEERDRLKADWLNLLFTDQSVAAMSPEGPLPTAHEGGNLDSPNALVIWLGDDSQNEAAAVREVASQVGSAAFVSLAWAQHPAAEAFADFSLKLPEVVDGSFFLRDRQAFENQDLDLLHDVELLGRCLAESIETKLGEFGLSWDKVVILGFGKGAGIALYASLLNIFAQQVAATVLFSRPIVLFPSFLAEKMQALRQTTTGKMKVFAVWGNRNRSTPGTYRQLLAQTMRKAKDVVFTPDTLPDGDHSFDMKSTEPRQSNSDRLLFEPCGHPNDHGSICKADPEAWAVLRLPSVGHQAKDWSWPARSILAQRKLETLQIGSCPREGSKLDQLLLRCKDLWHAANILVDAGYGVGPADMMEAPAGLEGDGVWALVDEGGRPPALRDLKLEGADVRLQVQTSSHVVFAEVSSSPEGGRAEASSAGKRATGGHEEPEVTIRLQAPRLGEASARRWAKVATSGVVSAKEPLKRAANCTVALELVAAGPSDLHGYWIFTAGLFVMVVAPRKSLGSCFCMSDVALESLCGRTAPLERRSLCDAVAGKVDETSGALTVLCRSWAPEAAGSCFYDPATGTGGRIEVFEEDRLVVHRRTDGSELRWKILKMEANPFPAAGTSDEPEEDADDAPEDSKAEPSRRRDAKTARRSDQDTSHSLPRSRSREETKEKQKARAKKAKNIDKEPKESAKAKEKGQQKEKQAVQEKEAVTEHPKEREKRVKERRERDCERDREKARDRQQTDRDREEWRARERQKARERMREEREAERSRERDRDKERNHRDRHKDKSREPSRDREKPRRQLERSHAFDKAAAPKSTSIPAGQSSALPVTATSATSLLAAAAYQARIEPSLPNPEVEHFLSLNSVEPHAAAKLRSLPRALQRSVLERGSLMGARDPSAVLISRVRDIMMSTAHAMPTLPIVSVTLPNGQQVHPGVEALILRFGLDAQCAQQLRQLPLQLQAVAAELPVHEARNPSAFVMAQLQLPRFKQAAAAAKAMQGTIAALFSFHHIGSELAWPLAMGKDPALVTMESQPLTARRLSWADQNASELASTIPQAPEPPPIGDIGEEDDDDEEVDRPGVRTLEMGILLQGYAYRSWVELPSNGQLVEVVGPLPAGIDILVKDEGSPEHPAALWIEAELKDLGVFYHGLLVRIAGGEFAEVVVNLKACVVGPREGRLSRIHHNVELIRALAPEDVHGLSEGSVFRKAAQLMEEDDEDDG